jgi:hypothetical protein
LNWQLVLRRAWFRDEEAAGSNPAIPTKVRVIFRLRIERFRRDGGAALQADRAIARRAFFFLRSASGFAAA